MELSEIYRNLSSEELELLNRIIKKYGANHWEVGKQQLINFIQYEIWKSCSSIASCSRT